MLWQVRSTVILLILCFFLSPLVSLAQTYDDLPDNCYFKCADQYQFLTNINGNMEIKGFYQVFLRISSSIKLSTETDIFAEPLKGLHMNLLLLRNKNDEFGGIVVIPLSKSSEKFTPLPFATSSNSMTFKDLPLSIISECPSIAAFKSGKTKLIRAFDCYGASSFNYQNIKVVYSFDANKQANCWSDLANHKKPDLPQSCQGMKKLTPIVFSIAADAYSVKELLRCILSTSCKYVNFPSSVK